MLLDLKKISRVFFIVYVVFLPQYSFAAVGNEMLIDNKVNPVVFFVDRVDETREILQKLQLHKIVSLVGVTNIGKTEILRKYALNNQDKYELIWFFDASLDLNEQFVSLAKKINQTILRTSTEKIPEDANLSQEDTIKFLTKRKNWLLVFDNLKLNQNGRVSNIINWDHNGHIIISSQDSKNLPNNIFIHGLDKGNALILLQKVLGSKLEHRKTFEQLIEIFKGYPGPIVQGALLLKDNSYLSIDEYKNILTQSSDPLGKHMELILNLLSEDDKKLLLQIALLNNQNFSKNLLDLLADNRDSGGVALYNINRFGLIKNTTTEGDVSLFEMHDAVRNEVLKLSTKEKIKEEISDIIRKLNLIMPKGVASHHLFTTSDKTIQSNLEILLENAEKYKIDINKILGLRRNLVRYYLSSLDYYNIEKMKIWLEQNENSEALLSNDMTNEQKINYAWYLLYVGIYEEFNRADYVKALFYYNKAKAISNGIIDNPELESSILLQTAQLQIFGGDIVNANHNMLEVDRLIKAYPDADFEMGLYWFIKAKISLLAGEYNNALIAIDNNIKAESHLPQDTFTAPTYILQSEILNYMGKYKKSYKIIKRIKEQEASLHSDEHEMQARILIQLSRAELGLGLVDSALTSATAACNIYQKIIDNYNITAVINIDFAAALVAKGDALYKKNEFAQALAAYNAGEIIYFRRYSDNYYRMDDISYLLSQGAKASCLSKNIFWKRHFYDQLIANFNNNHPRVLDTILFCNKSGF
jgi:hypothetical protein